MDLFKNKIFVIDYETTGINPMIARPIQFGCVVMNPDLTIAERVETYIKPPRFCRYAEAQKIHQIPKKVARTNGITEKEFCKFLEQFVAEHGGKDNIIFGGNNAHYDFYITQQAFNRKGMKMPLRYSGLMDISSYARLLSIDKPSLENLCQMFGIKNEKAHSALADAEATAQILRIIITKLGV